MKVYLIDDDSEEGDLFREALERINQAIDFVWHDNVMQALDALLREEEQPHVLFLDLNIPEVPGKQLLKLLRENHVTKQLPVVIYSTSISKRDIEETSVYNVKAYLQKPENFQTLCTRLSELLPHS